MTLSDDVIRTMSHEYDLIWLHDASVDYLYPHSGIITVQNDEKCHILANFVHLPFSKCTQVETRSNFFMKLHIIIPWTIIKTSALVRSKKFHSEFVNCIELNWIWIELKKCNFFSKNLGNVSDTGRSNLSSYRRIFLGNFPLPNDSPEKSKNDLEKFHKISDKTGSSRLIT